MYIDLTNGTSNCNCFGKKSGCCLVKRLKDVYAELGLYEAHVEGMWPSNSVLIGLCGD